MHMLGIFVATIIGLILQPLPTPSLTLIGLAVAMVTGTMSVPDGEALAGFANSTVLLIVAAFFIADGFLLTGLGRRVALMFVSRLGKSPMGIAYGMAATDLILAPATPSNTARAGGVVYPIIRSIAEVQNSTPETDESRRKLGSYLTFTASHVNVVTSAMFVTAMAGNPVAQQAAIDMGIEVTWGNWALAAIVPGLLSLAVVPWAMSKIYGPTVKKTPEAPDMARRELTTMGKISRGEITMIFTFVLLLVLWIFGSSIGIDATTAAFVGIAIMLLTRVLTWKDMAANGSAWNTLIFFAVLVGMAGHLNDLGVIDWIGSVVSGMVGGMPGVWPSASWRSSTSTCTTCLPPTPHRSWPCTRCSSPRQLQPELPAVRCPGLRFHRQPVRHPDALLLRPGRRDLRFRLREGPRVGTRGLHHVHHPDPDLDRGGRRMDGPSRYVELELSTGTPIFRGMCLPENVRQCTSSRCFSASRARTTPRAAVLPARVAPSVEADEP